MWFLLFEVTGVDLNEICVEVLVIGFSVVAPDQYFVVVETVTSLVLIRLLVWIHSF